MATIKAMIADKLQQENRETADYVIKGKIRQYLEKICLLLPDETPAGQDFAKLIFKIQEEWHKKVVTMLIEYASEEGNDLVDYPHLRQTLVEAINEWR